MTDALLQCLEDGQRALESGRHAEAIDAFRRGRALRPADVLVTMALANAYRASGDLLLTRATLLDAWAQADWSAVTAAFALGTALLDAGAPREAGACFQRVLKAHPHDPAALGALAGAKRALGEPGAAWPLAHQAVTKAPSNPALLLTAAQVRHDLGDFAGARRWLDRADAVRPHHAPTLMQRAYSLLIESPSTEGWRLFEARPLPVPGTSARAWHGEPLDGQSVLVTAEQGVGDQFQFVRFIPRLYERGAARVIVECHADVVSLLLANGLEAIARGAAPETDWHVPMLSLPHRLHLDAEVGGALVPYVRAPRGAPTSLPPRDRPGTRRLGLVWAGNPAFTGRVTRDLDPAVLSSVLAVPGVEWVSLQHGEAGETDIDGLMRIPLPRDWASTAAILANLDGLVTTDTGIAHLAGAMGVQTWVLLQHVPDWRWGYRADRTPWYPHLRLLRQPRHGQWVAVVKALAQQIHQMN